MNTQNPWMTNGINFVGTATSHFQSDPLSTQGALSNWDWEVEKKRRGLPSGIKVELYDGILPHLLRKSDLYVARSAELGCNMYRFSLDLPRLYPRLHDFNEDLMADYVRLLARLLTSGQEPMVTLHHFTMPIRYMEYEFEGVRPTRGAWEHPDIVRFFRDAIKMVALFLLDKSKVRAALKGRGFKPDTLEELVEGGLLRYVMPFNEPGVTFGNSYLGGAFPPFKKGRVDLVWRALNKMVEAHEAMSDTIRALGVVFPGRKPLIGMGYNWQLFEGWGSSLFHAIDHYYTGRFEERVKSDWIGLHYYCRLALPGGPTKAEREMSEHPMFGDVYPVGILKLLNAMHRLYPQKPIFVSEIGFSEKRDRRRPYWILETVKYILEAGRQGVPTKGILLWSLANNLEWDLGMSQQFGLFSEAELAKPLEEGDAVQSWQVWQAVAHLLRNPSEEARASVEQLYSRAKIQWAAALEAIR